jgi:PAS domain S-box-containing protein
MKESSDDIRNKIIGLGKDSFHKSYYPQLQHHIQELERQKDAVEKKNKELVKMMAELRKSQKRLKKSESRYKALFNTANDSIFILNSDLKCMDCNLNARKLLMRPKKGIINQSPVMFSPKFQPDGQESAELYENLLLLTLKGKTQVVEWVLIKKNGTPVHTFVSLNSLDLSGEKAVLAIVRDITPIKKLEQEILVAKIKAEESERERFAKELHDGVGPILSTIKLYFQWLAESKDKKYRELIIEKGNKNIQEAINALREVSNNLSPHILINYGLEEGLKQFINNITSSGEMAIRLICNFNERFEKEIEFTLYRVIIELINNTVKHANASSINIHIYENTINQIEVKYQDNGIGFNVSEVLKSHSGLGMLNMQSRIQNLGGSMRFVSKRRKGLEVIVKIGKDIVSYGG